MRWARPAITLVAVGLAVFSGCAKEDAPATTMDPPAMPPVATPPATVAAEPPIDAATGFKMTGDWQLVRGNCTGCHSARLITQQRGTEQQWLTMIRWMQKKQNLWQFDPDTETRIIAYLAEHYPPQAARRRAAIPPDLMPPNPYKAQAFNQQRE